MINAPVSANLLASKRPAWLRAALWLIPAAAILAACGTPVNDAPPTTADAPFALETEWQAEYDEMNRVLPLSSAESAALSAAFETMQRELSDWLEGENGKRLMDLERRMAEAVRGRNVGEVDALVRQATPLRDALRQQAAAHRENLLNALTPANRTRWEGHRIAAHMLELMEPLNLAPEQAQAIRNSATPAFEQAQVRREPNPPAAAFLDLERWAEQQVLSPEQRQAYDAVKRKHSMRSLTF